MRSAALSSSRAAGSGLTGRRRRSGSTSSVSAAMTSSGSSSIVAPGFSDSATLKALRTTSGMMSGEVTRAFHFVIGRNRPTRSMNWWRLLVHPLEVGLAGERDDRRAVEEGVADRGHEVHRARAERAEADARAAGQPAVHVGHVGAALLVADRDERDARVGQRLVEVERLLARDPEDVPHALGLEALHEDIGRPATSAHFPTLILDHAMRTSYPEPSTATRRAMPAFRWRAQASRLLVCAARPRLRPVGPCRLAARDPRRRASGTASA